MRKNTPTYECRGKVLSVFDFFNDQVVVFFSVREITAGAILNAVLEDDKITTASIAERVKRTIAEQAVEFVIVSAFVTGEKLAVTVREKSAVCHRSVRLVHKENAQTVGTAVAGNSAACLCMQNFFKGDTFQNSGLHSITKLVADAGVGDKNSAVIDFGGVRQTVLHIAEKSAFESAVVFLTGAHCAAADLNTGLEF